MKRFLVSFLILSFFIWIGIVSFFYFKVHYSYMALFLSKNKIFNELFLLFLLALLSYALGRRIFLLFKFEFYSLLEEFVFASGVGWIILACGTMILGTSGLLSWEYAYGLIIGLSLLLIKELLLIVRIIIHKIKLLLEVKFNLVSVILGFLLGIAIFFAFIMVLTPPFEIGELSYLNSVYRHIGEDKISSFYFPSLIEWLFALGMLLDNVILAKLIHFYFGILIVTGIFAVMSRYSNLERGLFASCIFYINSLVIFLSQVARIELWVTFYVLLMIYSLLCWKVSNKMAWLTVIIGGVIVGSIVNQDLTPLLFLPTLLVLLAIVIAYFIYERILLKRVIFCVITGIFILTLCYEGYRINEMAPLKFIFGLETASEYVVRNTDKEFFPTIPE